MEHLPGTAPCGFLSFEDSGEILFLNAVLLEMLGCDPGAEAPRRVDEILSAASRVFYQTHFFPALKLNGAVEEVYLTLRGKGGVEAPVLVNAVRVMRGGVTVNDAVLLRISKRGRFEDELLRAKAEAERANRAKGDFLAALSHELRTPLTPVLLTALLLEDEPGLPETVRRQITGIRRNMELEVRLIDDLLDVTRISHGKLLLSRTDAGVHELLEHTLELVREEVKAKEIDLDVCFGAGFSCVSGDAVRLQQVFWNLIKNAVKFTPSGGRIAVSTRNPDAEHVGVRVTDTGIGIAPEILPRVFMAFEQGGIEDQRRFGGLGLGLAISSWITALHGGTIRAESQGAGKGSTFTVKLPGIPIPPEAAGISPAARAPAARPLRLLLVEDDSSSRETLALILRRAGHRVHTASGAEEALELAAANAFDLAVSDLGLPGRSGLELMRELAARYSLKGIALSGYGAESDVAEALEAGFSLHLLKPVRIDELKAALERAVASPAPL